MSEQHEDYTKFAEALPLLVWIAAPDGTLAYRNKQLREYTGGLAALDASIHPEDRRSALDAAKQAILQKAPYEFECRMRRASDGAYRWFVARVAPLLDERGDLIRWLGTAGDIDEQKRANDSLQFVLDVTRRLSSLRDVGAICQDLASVAVERFADGCVVALAGGDGSFSIAAAAHRDPVSTAQFAHDAAFARAIVENRAQQSAGSPASIVVPLCADDSTPLGAIAFLSAQPQSRFADADLRTAETVAERTAAAIATARAFAEQMRASERLRFLADASEALAKTFEIDPSLARIVNLATQSVADVAYIWRVGSDGALRIQSGSARDPRHAEPLHELIGHRILRPDGESRLRDLLASGKAYRAEPSVNDPARHAYFYEYSLAAMKRLDPQWLLRVPLFVGNRLAAALVFIRGTGSHAFDDRDEAMFEELGRRVAVSMAQTEVFERERRIATELQRAMLPRLELVPAMTGISFSASYRASSNDSDIGGDWYDVLPLADGKVVVSVGDVTGRGLRAAGLMSKLRQSLAMVSIFEPDPSRILDAVDCMLRQRGFDVVATAFVGIIDTHKQEITYANAGHPYPYLRFSGGTTTLEAEGLPLGLRDRHPGITRTARIAGAQMLVLYTDGLLEATRDILAGELRLRTALETDALLFAKSPADMICDLCLGDDALEDDAAVLAVTFASPRHWAFDVENARAANDARGEFIGYLRSYAAQGDFASAELIFGELIGNVVRHAPGPIEVHVEWEREYPRLHVIDRGKGFRRAPKLPEDPLKESGRGLFIIQTLGRHMDVEHVEGYGTHVTVELPVRRSAV